jgi:uncharacterized protein YydD (DUF2326 family)
MKKYTEIRGIITEVKIIAESNTTAKVEACFLDERIEAFRTKSELFTSITKAKKYFKV